MNPIDLKIIFTKLKEKCYKSLENIKKDLNLFYYNNIQFNRKYYSIISIIYSSQNKITKEIALIKKRFEIK